MSKLYYLFISFLFVCSMQSFGQNIRKDSVVLSESFESGAANTWSTYTSSSCSGYNWQIVKNAGKAAEGTDYFIGYPASSASSGCYSYLVSPNIDPANMNNNDSLSVEFYFYRYSVSTNDNLQVTIVDENGNTVHGTAQIYVDNSRSPSSLTGWDHLAWSFPYSALASLSTTNFKVAFAGVSDNGADILLDQIRIHHIYYQTVRKLNFVSDFTGDTLTEGESVAVSWSNQNASKADISYSYDSGKNYDIMDTAVSSPYTWIVPKDTTKHGFLKLEADLDNTVTAVNGPFVIAYPLKMINYKGGDSVMGGSTTKIEWRSRKTVSKVSIAFSVDGGLNFVNIATGVPSAVNTNNSYTWSVPAVISNTAKIKITGDDGSVVESDAYFKITHNSGIAGADVHQAFRIYPNPVHDKLVVQFPSGAAENSILNIYDVNGKSIYRESISKGADHSTINTQTFGQGVFIIELNNGKNISRQEVVVN